MSILQRNRDQSSGIDPTTGMPLGASMGRSGGEQGILSRLLDFRTGSAALDAPQRLAGHIRDSFLSPEERGSEDRARLLRRASNQGALPSLLASEDELLQNPTVRGRVQDDPRLSGLLGIQNYPAPSMEPGDQARVARLPPLSGESRLRESMYDELLKNPEMAASMIMRRPNQNRTGVFPPGTTFRVENGVLIGTTPDGTMISGGRVPAKNPRVIRPFSNEYTSAEAAAIAKAISQRGGKAKVVQGATPGYSRVVTLIRPGAGRAQNPAAKLRDARTTIKYLDDVKEGKVAGDQASWDAAATLHQEPPWQSVIDPTTGRFSARQYAKALAAMDILGDVVDDEGEDFLDEEEADDDFDMTGTE